MRSAGLAEASSEACRPRSWTRRTSALGRDFLAPLDQPNAQASVILSILLEAPASLPIRATLGNSVCSIAKLYPIIGVAGRHDGRKRLSKGQNVTNNVRIVSESECYGATLHEPGVKDGYLVMGRCDPLR
jgi:hypothetical protein